MAHQSPHYPGSVFPAPDHAGHPQQNSYAMATHDDLVEVQRRFTNRAYFRSFIGSPEMRVKLVRHRSANWAMLV